MRHGYTNATTREGTVVTKSYRGPGARRRCAHEAAVLSALAGTLPVPPILGQTPTTLRLGFLPGTHGQDQLAAGHPREVLHACGSMLRRIHEIPPERFREEPHAGQEPNPGHEPSAGLRGVLVHGDYGPNNVLLDTAAREVVAVVDWEWAHVGDPLEDLAWCEWIVRMHHPGEIGALGVFFEAYGSRPGWTARQQVMVTRCQELLDLCRAWQPDGDAARRWQYRLAATESWTE